MSTVYLIKTKPKTNHKVNGKENWTKICIYTSCCFLQIIFFFCLEMMAKFKGAASCFSFVVSMQCCVGRGGKHQLPLSSSFFLASLKLGLQSYPCPLLHGDLSILMKMEQLFFVHFYSQSC